MNVRREDNRGRRPAFTQLCREVCVPILSTPPNISLIRFIQQIIYFTPGNECSGFNKDLRQGGCSHRFMSGFLNIYTMDILDQIIFCRGAILCISRILNFLPVPYPVDASNAHASMITKKNKSLHTLPNVPQETKLPPWRTTDLQGSERGTNS